MKFHEVTGRDDSES